MAGLRLVLLTLSLVWASPSVAGPLDRWAEHIAEASARFDVPESWIKSVMRAESGGRTMLNGRPIESRAGAMGLMQLMPGTWREMRAVHGLGADPHDPRDNILAGTAYLRSMYDRFGYPGLFAAYNAGPRRYAEHLATGRSLPQETLAYVVSVSGQAAAVLSAPEGVPATALFAVLATSAPDRAEVATFSPDQAGILFVRLRASRSE